MTRRQIIAEGCINLKSVRKLKCCFAPINGPGSTYNLPNNHHIPQDNSRSGIAPSPPASSQPFPRCSTHAQEDGKGSGWDRRLLGHSCMRRSILLLLWYMCHFFIVLYCSWLANFSACKKNIYPWKQRLFVLCTSVILLLNINTLVCSPD